jgi:hypothetical protein
MNTVIRSSTTRRFEVTPCVMLVALADGEAHLCAELVKPLTAGRPMQVMRVAHVRAACERALVIRPMVIVYSETLESDDRGHLAERAEDISAVVLELPRVIDRDLLTRSLFLAIREARLRHDE